MIAHVFKPRRKNNAGKSVTARLYRGRYRLDGDYSVTEIPLNTSDRHVAERKLSSIVAEKEREKAGVIAPKEERDAAKRPLSEHRADFVADLEIQGRNAQYVERITSRTQRLFSECRWTFFKDISPNDFVAWRSRQKKAAPKTLNEYLNAACALINWCVRNGRLPSNPLNSVSKLNIRGRQKKRRALTDDELQRLVQAAPQRRLLYLTAAYTGLRINELRQLLVLDANLDDPNPHFKVRSSTTKNKKDAIAPIHPGLLDELRNSLSGRKPGDPVFFLTKRPHETIDHDFKKAGIAKTDELGRKVDFHALRNTFATKLARAGVPQRLAQELMRHSDPKLTAMIYTDASQLPTFSAVEKLSWHEAGETEGDADAPQIAPQDLDPDGPAMSQDDGTPQGVEALQAVEDEADIHAKSSFDAEIKMASRRGFEPLSQG